jgi:anti-sigma factor RsiW
MLEERTLHLINGDLDGELSPSEKNELNAILESSPEARAMKQELQKLNNLLDAVPDLPPPPGLTEQVLNRMAPSMPRAPFSLARFFGAFQPASAGLAFAAGLLIAIGFYEFSPRSLSPSDTASMVGAMVAQDAGEGVLLKHDVAFRGDGYSGKISLRDVDFHSRPRSRIN